MGASLDELDSMLQCHDINTSIVFGSETNVEGEFLNFLFSMWYVLYLFPIRVLTYRCS